jgi:glucose-1-phosphate thymidylyltransferase
MSSAGYWKGIILAGGSGTRLHPLTLSVSKQIMPVYDKPMIYYPLSVLMLAGIRDICIISTPRDLPLFRDLLGTGGQWGCSFSFMIQERPEGIAQAFLLAESHIAGANACLILGDNIFFGHGLDRHLAAAMSRQDGATVFGYHVSDPERYGVVSFGPGGVVSGIEEKPLQPKSRYAVTGLYFYDGRVPDLVRALRPSARGELEITDLNNAYLALGKLNVELLGRGIAWLDTGTHDALLAASVFVQAVESRQGLKVACLEEIAWRMGFISAERMKMLGEELKMTNYGQYILSLIQ